MIVFCSCIGIHFARRSKRSFNIYALIAGSEYAYVIKPTPTFKITQTDCESARCVGALLNASHACVCTRKGALLA